MAAGEIRTLRARAISDSGLGLSFICVSEFVFTQESLLVNPKDEALAEQFKDVKSLHFIHAHHCLYRRAGPRAQRASTRTGSIPTVVYPGGNDGNKT